ncbi:MAG TPA: hypothetical protein VFI47_08710 [Acidimicrobiales bacterium]|nr:hypothetical protein [Acidimicrobiales bacterium]
MAIVGNSGGPGILATDACDAVGLEIPELGADTQAALREFIDPNGAVANPVDLVASATPAIYEQAVRLVLADEAIDAAIVICTHTFAAPPASVAEVLPRAASGVTKPVVGCFLAAPNCRPRSPAGGRHPGLPVARACRPRPGPGRHVRRVAATATRAGSRAPGIRHRPRPRGPRPGRRRAGGRELAVGRPG